MSAGIMFVSDQHVLAGYSAKGYIDGFGGKCVGRETDMETALRETFEELLSIPVPKCVSERMGDDLWPLYVNIEPDYTLFIYLFEDLELMLALTDAQSIQSPLYDVFPLTISELLFGRKNYGCTEIQQLVLLPRLPRLSDTVITDHLIRDMRLASACRLSPA